MIKGGSTLIPGQGLLLSGLGSIGNSVLLLAGGSGSGKTLYSIEFLRGGVSVGSDCLYIGCNQSLNKERFESYFGKDKGSPEFISLFDGPHQGDRLSNLFERISNWLANSQSNESVPVKIVLDSITDLTARFPNETIQKFVAQLYDTLKANNGMALFSITGVPSDASVDRFGSLVDGILQLRIEESGGEVERSMRLFSLKSISHSPKWIKFSIKQDGSLKFDAAKDSDSGVDLVCKLCNGPIIGQVADAESPFHPNCLDTYRKLSELYGSHILYALEPGVINANFFFVDIVGLSNPLLSVERQIRKIQDLNSLIQSCDAYSKVPKDKKIVLPTGDGMAIGFLLNPELPLQLSMQLHRKLRAFNAKAASDSGLGVRIGLSSGPVFVVSDVNNNQNVWGPGIILARRVMDLGDEGHILLADSIAEPLMNLKDEYRKIIRIVADAYKIKHGQALKLYSAYSQDFGNPSMPARIELS